MARMLREAVGERQHQSGCRPRGRIPAGVHPNGAWPRGCPSCPPLNDNLSVSQGLSLRGEVTALQVRQEPLGEHLGMLAMHEMPAGDLLDDVVVLEHPGGA